MEGGIEHGHLGLAGHDLLTGLDALEVGGVVEGAQGDAVADGLLAGLVDDAGLDELVAAVQHAVTHRVHLVQGLDDAVALVHQDVQDGGDGLGMGGHGDVAGHLLALGGDAVRQTAVDADALTEALGADPAGIRVHELILQRGRACVDDKNIHSYKKKKSMLSHDFVIK